jgi:BirA family biotin operon repressor/biotin-[acetyl-CoA-carboxylase] ligase
LHPEYPPKGFVLILINAPDPILTAALPGWLTHGTRSNGGTAAAGDWARFDPALWTALTGEFPARTVSEHPLPFWGRCYALAEAPDSQYAALRAVIQQCGGLPGHLICLALAGRGFQGQQGRRWRARRGNLHLTLGLKCDLPAVVHAPALPMLPAVAVMDAIGPWLAAGGPACGIKWVNDIVSGPRKLGGVLTSIRTTEGRITSVVLGIGLNVNVAPDIAPTVFVPGTTRLADLTVGPEPSLETTLQAVLAAVAARWQELAAAGPQPLVDAYRAASVVVGRRVGIWPAATVVRESTEPMPPPARTGTVAAIGPALEILLDGQDEPVTAGRLAILPI